GGGEAGQDEQGEQGEASHGGHLLVRQSRARIAFTVPRATAIVREKKVVRGLGPDRSKPADDGLSRTAKVNQGMRRNPAPDYPFRAVPGAPAGMLREGVSFHSSAHTQRLCPTMILCRLISLKDMRPPFYPIGTFPRPHGGPFRESASPRLVIWAGYCRIGRA